MRITLPPCVAGNVFPLLPTGAASYVGPCARMAAPLPHFPVGTEFFVENTSGEPCVQVCGQVTVPAVPHALCGPLLLVRAGHTGDKAERSGEIEMEVRRSGFAVAVITLSDKGAAGLREDESGPLALAMTREALPVCFGQNFVLPDEPRTLRALVTELALSQGYDLVLTTGGTGLTSRDTTPEALLPILERRLHGFEQAMMQASLVKTPHAMLSRAVAGSLGHTLVITLPGSKRAVAENLAVILPACGHAMEKLQDDPADCGRA